MINTIIANEWKQWRRDKRLMALSVFLLLISAIALWHQLDFQSNLLRTRQHAQEDSRREWLAQELKHPHMAAHFGNYAYKKPSLLHCFDPGLTIYTGTSLYMEPHRQNDFLFSKSQESDSGVRFGWLSPALICQLLIPLLIIILSFNIINGEYEKGTMPVLLAQGLNFRQIMIAKTMAVFYLFELFITAFLLVTCLSAWILLKVEIDWAAVGYIWLAYSAYCLIWSISGVIISSRIRRAGSAIAVLLLIWTCANILLPRMAANLAENMYPLTSNYAFKKSIAVAIEKGLDGHDSKSERAKKLEQELLAKYKVDSVIKLPFNFEGFVMQQGEEYSSIVYDRYFGGIFKSLKQQKELQGAIGILSPYICLRNISMTISNAGVESEIDFQQQAEQYRRKFVQSMNDDMRDNSAFGSFETYKVSEDKYTSISDLEIAPHQLNWLLPQIKLENAWLLAWVIFLLAFLLKNNKSPLQQ